MSFFGHHHAAEPSLPERVGQLFAHAAGFVQHTPAVLWAGVLGVVGGVATPVVGHVLDARREKAKSALESERERAETEKIAARVVTDLRARLRRHLALLQHQFGSDGLDLRSWEHSHDDLARRARDADVIDTFGVHYAQFADTLAAEALALAAARQRNAVDGRLGDVMRSYAPFLRALGDDRAASEAERAAASLPGRR